MRALSCIKWPFLVILLRLAPCWTSKLNVPRVLLPYNHDGPIHFTLKVYEGGCYQWSCSRDELVSLTEEVGEDGCANEVRVSAVSRSPTRQTAIILARDTGGVGNVLRCDVLIDTIQRLEIVTTTRELYVEEAPEEFEVRAYDDQGNEFSTLEGVEMFWDLETLTDRESVVAAQTVLRFMTFEESPYETPPAIGPLEDAGVRGYMVLVEGRQTGSARLSVRLSHPAYQHIAPAEVDLMVVANLLLEPADVTLLPHTTVTYTVYQLKQGQLIFIDLQYSQYYLQVADTEIGELEDDGISFQAKTLGNTKVILRDKNVAESSVWVKQPSASVRVVEPSYLELSVVPPYGPNLVTGRRVALAAAAYDANHNRIFLTENVVMETMVPSEYFTPELVTKNGSYIYGVPIKEGKTVATATLSAVDVDGSLLEISPPLSATLDLAIYPPLSVLPPLTILPWDPVTAPSHTVNLTVEGGSGGVSWSSSRSDVASVSGVGTCVTKTTGTTTITAASTIDHHNKDKAQIHILEALGLSILEGVVEAEVDEKLALHLASHTTTLDGRQRPFTHCHRLTFDVQPSEVTFEALPDVFPPSEPESCAKVEVVGKSPGFSTISVSYHTTTGPLQTSTLIAAYRPVVAVEPASGETLLAVGSSRVVVFRGGPLPWPSHKASMHTATVTVGDSEVFEARLVGGRQRGSDVHGVEVVCLGVGEANLNITITNKPSSALPHPRKASGGVRVLCGVPDSLTLVALTPRPSTTTASCPTNHDTPVTIGHYQKPLSLEVVVVDSEGRKFDNVSSLGVSWSLSDPTLAAPPHQDPPSLSQVTTVHGLTVPVRTYQVLEPVGVEGEVTVTAVLTVTEQGDSKSEPVLTTSLLVRLVRDATINPPTAVLYRHHDNKVELKIEGGSGHFELQTAESDVVAITHRTQDRSIIVRPLSDGEVTVVVADLCLEADTHPSTHITVASIATLDLSVSERVEVGGTVEAEVLARPVLGDTLPAHTLMSLSPHPQSNIISLTYKGINERGNAVYEVKGRHVGDTSLRVSAAGRSVGGGDSGESGETERVYSPTRPIQVFPPLTLHPSNITLIVGAVYQVETRGGPYPDAVVEFSVVNGTIATASHTGLVTAVALGTTTLTAAALTHTRDTPPTRLYSKDSVIINVVPLEKVRIYAPLRQLEAGTSMPLYALGKDATHQGPASFATTLPHLSFQWSLSDTKAASVSGLYTENGIVEGVENQGIVRLKAVRAGRVTVSLKVQPMLPATLSQHIQLPDNLQLTDKLEIKIYEALRLKNLDGGSPQLLLTPHSQAKIITNRDGDSPLSYHVEESVVDGEEAVVSVLSDGVVVAGGRLGKAVVVVTAQEAHGVTHSISVLVEVKKVRYLQLSVGGVMGSSSSSSSDNRGLTQIPPGATLPVTITRHDDRGRTFHATTSYPALRTSRFDLVGVSVGGDNSSLAVDVRGSGQTILQVWDITPPTTTTATTTTNNQQSLPITLPSPTALAFLRIDSGSAIFPDRISAPQGVPVCFSSPLIGPDGGDGRWWGGVVGQQGSGEGGDMTGVVTVDPVTGVAVSHRPGEATVSYQVSPEVTAATHITVLPITQIEVLSPSQAVTNGVEGDWQVAYVTIEADGSTVTSSCLPSTLPPSLPPFTCHLRSRSPHPELDLKDIFYTSAVYVANKGFGCRVRSLDAPGSKLSSWSGGLYVEVVTGEGVSGRAEVTFHPTPTLEVTHVTVTLDQPSYDLAVIGTPVVLNALQVPVGGGVGGVEVILGSITGEGNKRVVTVVGREGAWSTTDLPPGPITLTLASPLTRNTIQLNVTVESGGEGCVRVEPLGMLSSFFTHYDKLTFYILCIILTIVCIFIGYHALLGPGYKQTRHSGVFANSPAPPPPLSPFSPASPKTSPSATPLHPGRVSPSPQRPSLWSVANEPVVYGAAQFPRSAYQGSPTYTPTK